MAPNRLAISGEKPGYMPQCNTFDWALSQPYQNQSDYTPRDHRVTEIESSRKIFVDDKTGRYHMIHTQDLWSKGKQD